MLSLVLICCMVWLLVSVLSVLMKFFLCRYFYSFLVFSWVSECFMCMVLCRWIMLVVL